MNDDSTTLYAPQLKLWTAMVAATLALFAGQYAGAAEEFDLKALGKQKAQEGSEVIVPFEKRLLVAHTEQESFRLLRLMKVQFEAWQKETETIDGHLKTNAELIRNVRGAKLEEQVNYVSNIVEKIWTRRPDSKAAIEKEAIYLDPNDVADENAKIDPFEAWIKSLSLPRRELESRIIFTEKTIEDFPPRYYTPWNVETVELISLAILNDIDYLESLTDKDGNRAISDYVIADVLNRKLVTWNWLEPASLRGDIYPFTPLRRQLIERALDFRALDPYLVVLFNAFLARDIDKFIKPPTIEMTQKYQEALRQMSISVLPTQPVTVTYMKLGGSISQSPVRIPKTLNAEIKFIESWFRQYHIATPSQIQSNDVSAQKLESIIHVNREAAIRGIPPDECTYLLGGA